MLQLSATESSQIYEKNHAKFRELRQLPLYRDHGEQGEFRGLRRQVNRLNHFVKLNRIAFQHNSEFEHVWKGGAVSEITKTFAYIPAH